MDTKSKNDGTIIWSTIALVLAACSIGYCLTFITHLWDIETLRSSETIAQLTRLIKGELLS